MIQIFKKLFGVASSRLTIDGYDASKLKEWEFDNLVRSAYVLSKVEGWLEDEVWDLEAHAVGDNDEEIVSTTDYNVCYGSRECAESLIRQIAKWRLEI